MCVIHCLCLSLQRLCVNHWWCWWWLWRSWWRWWCWWWWYWWWSWGQRGSGTSPRRRHCAARTVLCSEPLSIIDVYILVCKRACSMSYFEVVFLLEPNCIQVSGSCQVAELHTTLQIFGGPQTVVCKRVRGQKGLGVKLFVWKYLCVKASLRESVYV